KVMVQQQEMGDLLADLRVDVGGPVLSELAQDFDTIERMIHAIQGYGCVVKDINVGLLDFPAEKDGQEVFLCWRYGEEEIAYYHDIHEGFNGRSLID
ncbi:MAG: DUF2203 family protein, partial [Aquificales bacterium]|nr:DUF2203 family protein [Aquificales bacterium]